MAGEVINDKFIIILSWIVGTSIAGDLLINAGGMSLNHGFRCDTGKYVKNQPNSITVKTDRPSTTTRGWRKNYDTHRESVRGDLIYIIPVPNGEYTVWLYFMETVPTVREGSRVFTVSIQDQHVMQINRGQPLDVFSKNGLDRGLFVNAYKRIVSNGTMKIALGRIPGKGNPMISGIVIRGKNADTLVGNEGITSCPSLTNKISTSIDLRLKKKAPRAARFDDCPRTSDVFINVGGENFGEMFRCDTGSFVSSSKTYSTTTKLSFMGGCTEQYKSHRFSEGGKPLVFNIPVPKGTYFVYLHFMETYFSLSNKRLFTLKINNKTAVGVPHKLDVFNLAGGKDVPYFVDAGKVTSKGRIVIELGAVPGKNNPMISGIGIVGSDADNLVGVIGLKSCSKVTPKSTVICGSNNKVNTDFKNDFHLAHAVSAGPYVKTDFDKDGRAIVELNGIGSHSHSSDPAPGQIVDYSWSWIDPGNRAAVNGVVIMKGPTPKPEFPLGTTTIRLEVRDQYCNKAAENTTVTINSASKSGAYCYFYDFMHSKPKTVPIPFLSTELKPEYASSVGEINFQNTESFGKFRFVSNSFAVRCVFMIKVMTAGVVAYNIRHSGPIKVYSNSELVAVSDIFIINQKTKTKPKFFGIGLHEWQILYFRIDNSPGLLQLQASDGSIISSDVVRHNAADSLPVITDVAPREASPGEFVTIHGSGFFNNVLVKFGNAVAEGLVSNTGSIQLRVPNPISGQLVVEIVVETGAGESNGVSFTYPQVVEPCQIVKFTESSILSSNGKTYEIPDIAVLKYGPDGRLYLGSQKSKVHVLTLDRDLKVTRKCTKEIQEDGVPRWILGIAFNHKSTQLKMYFLSSTFNWKKLNFISDFYHGWSNGKVQSVTLDSATSCFSDAVSDVVTGLPVTNHDHGINALQFLPDGRMLIFIGGFTNGGISEPNDLLGGIPPAPLAGAIVSCPIDGTAEIKYSNLTDPSRARVISGGCKIYATGLRNSFSGEFHTNGNLYVTDNGPNQGFGAFSTDCNGGKTFARNVPDRLIKVEEGKCHGHPHIPRGKAGDANQCVYNSSNCVKALLTNLQSSTNGVLEYRSNLFRGKMKTDLLLAKFSDTANKVGKITRVKLNRFGTIAQNGVTSQFESDSGLSLVEGPRGEIIMSRVFKRSFIVFKPICAKPVRTTFLIGVHPKRGPADGAHKVLITGYNFGKVPTAKFGDLPCTEVEVIDEDSFTCFTPPGVENTQVKVIVVGIAGENVPTKGSDYWYW